MHAFDYVMTLLSFVYALAIAHVLAAAGDIIGAWQRVRFSWLNAAWMVFALLGVLAWWIGLWGLRAAQAWGMDTVAIFFVLAAILYLEARLVCARIPSEGTIDLAAFHRQAGPKYMAFYAVLAGATVAVNKFYFSSIDSKNLAVMVMFVASLVGAIFPNRWVQTAVVISVAATWIFYFSKLQNALS